MPTTTAKRPARRPKPTEAQRNIRTAASAQRRVYAARAETVRKEQEARAQSRAEQYKAREAYSQAVTAEQIARARAQANIRAERAAQRSSQSQTGLVQRAAISTVGSTVGPSSGFGSTMLLIVFTMAGLILVYILVTRAQQFSGFTQSIGVALSKLTSTEPLFQKVSTQK